MLNLLLSLLAIGFLPLALSISLEWIARVDRAPASAAPSATSEGPVGAPRPHLQVRCRYVTSEAGPKWVARRAGRMRIDGPEEKCGRPSRSRSTSW